ncbi:MAG: GIY-YIG nuclease family protein [Ignavibacteriales bacterium]|nr:GIY-YIG nuclease family protein [Ignavibacteriales bacterium]
MYYVYVLKSQKDGKQYIGSSSDVTKRLKQHNAGRTISTARRRPFVLIYTEQYQTREEAATREKYLKSGKGREELKKIFERRTAPAAGGQEW